MSVTVAVVPAAGSGERLAAGVPKAFYQLDGRTLVERAVDGLLESGVVDRVVVAVPADRTDRVLNMSAPCTKLSVCQPPLDMPDAPDLHRCSTRVGATC